MALFKITLCFEALGDQDSGWTESYYTQGPGTLPAAVAEASNLAFVRFQSLASTVTIPWARVTAWPPGQGMSQLVALRRNGGALYTGQIPGQAGAPVVKGLLRLVNTLNGVTRQPFGGLGLANFQANGSLSVTGPTVQPLNGFIKYLSDNDYCTRKITQPSMPYPAVVAGQKYLITAIGPGNSVIIPLANFAVGAVVRIGRVPRGQGVSGTWTVATVAGNVYSFYGFPTLAAAVNPRKSSYAQQQIYSYVPIAGIPATSTAGGLRTGLTRQTERKPGRPTNPSSGRRKKLLA